MSELVLMRLERANYIRGGGSNWDGIMTEKDKSGGVDIFISFAQQTHVLGLIFQTCACWDHFVPPQWKTQAR